MERGPEVIEEEDGEAYEMTVFEGFDRSEVPEEADYLICVLLDGEESAVQRHFGMDLKDAQDVAVEEMRKVNSGYYR